MKRRALRHPKGARKTRSLSFVKGGLKDLSVTRTSFDWGIKLPKSANDDKHVMYVWLDALINYLTTLGYSRDNARMDFWPHTTHIVGKDIFALSRSLLAGIFDEPWLATAKTRRSARLVDDRWRKDEQKQGQRHQPKRGRKRLWT